MSTQPHVLQRHALHHLHEHLGTSGRGVIVMPCGSGKTLLGRWFAEQIAARITVVFVPSLALVPQTVLAYREGAAWKHQTMIVCSDPTSGRAVALDDLDLPEWARESVTASTSARVVQDFLAGGGPGRVIVSTYHSAPRVAAALQHACATVDLVVCDEAHRLTGQPRREFRSVLDDDALPARRRVFLTATPVEAAAWAADTDTDDVAAPLSLDDEDLFGPTIYRATFADAVAAARLVDYDVEVLAVRPDAINPTETPGAADAVLTAIRAGARRVLTFHSRVAHARHLADLLDGRQLPDGPVVHAEHLEARHGARRRAAALTRLADPGPDTAAVLASARILTEGVDVPAVDTVVFAEPRTSAVDIVQAVGRAMRLAPGKTRGRIVLAVTTSGADIDEDTELAGTAWRHVWITLRALASMDPRFAAQLRNGPNPWTGGEHRPHSGPGLRLALPDGLDPDQWMLRALDRTGGSWQRCHDLLAAHADEHGSARPNPKARRGGVALGSWVARQRTLNRQGALEPDRVAALEKLPGWAWDAREIAWWVAAAAWERCGGAARLPDPERWETLADTRGWTGMPVPPARRYDTLAEFMVETCARRRRGELPGHLERAAELLPGWRWDGLPDDDARMVDALLEYAEWEKTLNPPHDYTNDDGLRLGPWLTAVRRRRYTGRLAPALELELQMLARHGWEPLRWEKGETAWRLGYLALRQYVTREGKARVPQDHVEALPDHEVNLSRWCTVQRLGHRRGRLSPERVAALQGVSGWQWEVELREGYRPVLGDAQHGQRASYAKGCRCDLCTDANRAYETARQTGQTDLVDAGPARAHVQRLLARGAGQKPLARAAGVNVKTVVELADGTLRRIRPETEQVLLALTVEAAAAHTGAGRWGGSVPAGPTWRLIDWMVMRGWPKSWISREIGQGGRALQLNRTRISKGSAEAVAELDRRLGRTRRPPARRSNRLGGELLPTLDELLAAEQAAS